MLVTSAHRCGDGCTCPRHGTPLFYWPAGDDHACQDPGCEFAHGINAVLVKCPVLLRRRDPAEAERLTREGLAAQRQIRLPAAEGNT